MNLTTRELLYLEDLTKLFESVQKNCNRGSQTTTDPQVKSLLQNLSQDQQQWMQSISTIVTHNGNLQ